MKILPILLLLVVSASSVAPQSGRRISTNRTAPIAPVQPSLNPEPEVRPTKPTSSALMFLPEKVLERRIKALDGNTFRLADFHGKVMVINIWASWCGPCRREAPDYERVRKEYVARDDIQFIGLTVDDLDDVAKVNKLVRETGFGFLLGWADQEIAQVLTNGRRAVPQTIVIDRNGAVVNHWAGYAPRQGGTRLREAIENALK